jgi:hypothetical protein
MLKKFLLTSLAVASFSLNTAEININNEDLEVNAKVDLANINYNIEPDTMFLGAKFLYVDEDKSNNKNMHHFYEVNFLMMREVKDGLKFGLGLKVNHAKDFISSPLGFEFSYKIPNTDVIPIYFNGQYYYATKVLSYNDAETFMEYRINVDFEVIENGLLTVGYRKIDTNYEDKRGDITFNSSFFAGLKIKF